MKFCYKHVLLAQATLALVIPNRTGYVIEENLIAKAKSSLNMEDLIENKSYFIANASVTFDTSIDKQAEQLIPEFEFHVQPQPELTAEGTILEIPTEDIQVEPTVYVVDTIYLTIDFFFRKTDLSYTKLFDFFEHDSRLPRKNLTTSYHRLLYAIFGQKTKPNFHRLTTFFKKCKNTTTIIKLTHHRKRFSKNLLKIVSVKIYTPKIMAVFCTFWQDKN